MRAVIPPLILCLQIVGGLILFGGWLFLAALAVRFAGPGLRPLVALPLILLFFLHAWAIYAFLMNRHGRQDELAQVLTAAVGGGIPLAPAVRSYLQDMPTSQVKQTLDVFACVIMPLYGYIRIWIGWSFDGLVRDLASRLDSGESLSEALQSLPQVACREVRLAVTVGEATGALGPCLKGAERERWSSAWFEVVPRLLYPLLILMFVVSIASFLIGTIVPRFRRIFQEFGEPLPHITLALINLWEPFDDFWWLVPIVLCFGFVAMATVITNPTVRWYTPIIGRLYRWGIQAEILRALGRLLAVGRTVPQSLGFLTDAAVLPLVVRRRLDIATAIVERGEPLADALNGAGLLPSSMAPLVKAAEKARTLPWALGELGDHLASRALRLVRGVSLVVAPILVVAVGAVVGFIAIAMFLPLIQLLTRLST